MFVGSFLSPFHFGDDDALSSVIDPVDNSIIAYSDTIKGLHQFTTTNGTWRFGQSLDRF